MSANEKLVADYFLKIGTLDIDLSVSSLAKHLHISPATLTRFSKRCGFAGFKEFLFYFRQESALQNPKSQELHYSMTRRVLADYEELLQKTYTILNETQITKLAQWFVQAKHIYLFGKGSSGQVAQEMKMRFIRCGIICDAMTDNDYFVWFTNIVNPNSLVVGLSVSGKTTVVLDALKEAKTRGAKTVLLTSQPSVSNYNYIDEVVLIASAQHLNYGNRVTPQFPLLILMDILFAHIMSIGNFSMRHELYNQSIEKMKLSDASHHYKKEGKH